MPDDLADLTPQDWRAEPGQVPHYRLVPGASATPAAANPEGDDSGGTIADGIFRAIMPAYALGADLLTVLGEGTIEVTASVGFNGVMLQVVMPPSVGHCQSVWFTTHYGYARLYATTLDAASMQPTSVQLQAWSWDDPAAQVVVEVVADPAAFDGVYLHLGGDSPPVLVGRDDAANTAQAIHAAVDYLTAHGAQ